MQKLIDFFWPFHQFGESIEGKLGHLHESIRMKNRWQSHLFFPFVVRWAALTGVGGLSLDIVGRMDHTLLSWLLWMILWTVFVFGIFMTGFLYWLYSTGPKR